ncbi:hypothetical protein GCM10009660_06210 [Catellatospora bangladeshensis]|uniref:Uncharacterized protein n=1 Tax=Saccharothrix algeriensis TaxID=173560 RepID=A0ABS2S0S3_9PSEU|nr:hypothetical protein [Saccharothrix algeriensis]
MRDPLRRKTTCNFRANTRITSRTHFPTSPIRPGRSSPSWDADPVRLREAKGREDVTAERDDTKALSV